MRKTELDSPLLGQRKILVDRLSRAGWEEGDSNTLFESGEDTQLSAEMLYSSESAQLMIGLDSLAQKLFFSFEDEASGRTLDLLVTPLDRLPEVLEAIVAMQDVLNASNFREKIRLLLGSGAKLFVLKQDGNGEFAVPVDE